MDNLRRLGKELSIKIPSDAEGFTGRECPEKVCEGYFKIKCGTGLKGSNLPCHCPYCGHTAPHDNFWTKEQIEYAKSVALRKIEKAIHKDLKKLEFEIKPPRHGFGIGLSMKVKPGRRIALKQYAEKSLETHMTCTHCTLEFAIYGVFAYCPDCREHNSLQILFKNLELLEKMVDLAGTSEEQIASVLLQNALEDCVSSFDGFGREVARLHSPKATNAAQASKLSFQSLRSTQKSLLSLFGLDLSSAVSPTEWTALLKGFQKRHIIAHKMGIVDEEYLRLTNDPHAVVGRK